MDHVTSPWEPAERVEHVRELAARGDLAALSHVLLHPQDSWHEGLGVTTVLRGLPERDRSALARLFTEHRAGESADSPADDRGLVLLAAVSHGIAEDGWCEAWEALLTGMAEELWSSGISDELWTCAHALLDAGRRLPAEVVALLRRSALEHAWPAECTTPVLTRLRDPLLNPGEPWADAILAELPSLGEPWPAVIAHTLLAPLRRPTRTWDRQALTLTAPLPPEALRRTLIRWLTLAAPDGAYDPHNLPALAGLTWLLSLQPPHPTSTRTLSALIEVPPARTPLTGTAIRALSRFTVEGTPGNRSLANDGNPHTGG